ncbi:glyoxylate reductase/hydroxypyruvate reductase-like [Episyrphus balteatus]|uniref:glyoxylate reductase/hydroxypyruvate reductase-like n=1 Tax=Episyrphus balteatus TaxID=286459 RepID=UPI002486B2A1|nr:glyoxylate reductase/hydroxypyruvate reductase-like [Episyrphus balteatus]
MDRKLPQTVLDVLDKLKGKPKVLVTHPDVPQEAIDILSQKCKVTVLSSCPPVRTEILEKCKGMDAFLWGGHEALNAEILDAAGPQVKSISTMSAGYDFVDLEEIKKRKIPFGNTPEVLSVAVAELAIGLMISAARRFHEGRKHIESSTWNNASLKWMLGREVRGAKIGFFGFGSIAQAIADRLEGFEIGSIIYHTRRVSPAGNDYKAKHVTFDELLAQSDFIFIASPLTESTREKFNESAFNKMKSTAVLINIGRGQIVDQKALYNALKTNKIFSAGLDVMTPEPLPADDPLLSLPNCVLVPHLGSATERTRCDMGVIAAHNVLQGLAGEPMFAPVYQP